MTTELPWKGCCEHCGARLKRSERDHRFCQKCVDTDVYEDYYEADEASR